MRFKVLNYLVSCIQNSTVVNKYTVEHCFTNMQRAREVVHDSHTQNS